MLAITHNIPTRISVSGVDSLAFSNDLLDFATAFVNGTIVAGAEKLIGAVLIRWQRNRIERQDGKRLGEVLGGKVSPDLVDTSLRTRLSLLLFLLVLVVLVFPTRLSASVFIRLRVGAVAKCL